MWLQAQVTPGEIMGFHGMVQRFRGKEFLLYDARGA
jgi:hypothetical protein